MIGGDGAAAFGNDGGVRHLGFVADVLNVIDDVVGVFLQRVVDAGFEIGLRAVVIDAQAAADVQIFQARAGALQLHVDPRGFHHRGLDLPDVGDLAAEMEVQQLDAILHADGLHLIQRLQGLADGQAELGAIAAGRFPASRPSAGQLQPQSDGGPHADALRVLHDQIELGVFFDHRDDLAADFLGQHHHLDVLVVLEAVADDGRFVVGHRQHRQQFGLGAGFQAKMIRPAELEDLFHHLPLLVDLDRIHAAVIALVVVLGDGVLEGLVHFAQTMLQNFGEADQDGEPDAAQLELFDQLAQIDAARRLLAGMHPQVPVRADGKIAFAPTGDIVEFAGVGDGPPLGWLVNGGFTEFQFAVTSRARDGARLQCPAIWRPGQVNF